MPFSDETTVIITGKFLMMDATGTPATGSVTFTPTSSLGALTDATANEILIPKQIGPIVLVAGVLPPTALPASDDPDLTPVGYTWHVKEAISGRSGADREYDILIPFDAAGDTLDLADIPHVSSIGGFTAFATEAEMVALTARVATLEAETASAGGLDITFSKPGTISVATGKSRYYLHGSRTIDYVIASVGTQPVGSNIIIDVKKNGTTIFTTGGNRPTITPGSNENQSPAPNITALIANDYITVDVVQVGSTTAGADLTVEVITH